MIIASFIITLALFIRNVETESFIRQHKEKQEENCKSGSTNNYYDYIIVGSGTAGSIVARKLSDDPNNKVLLIEQGYWSSLNPNVQEASKWRLLLSDPLIDLGYVSVPQTGFKNRTISQPRAKVTGGCNNHNAMIFIIGNRKDFDERWGPIDGWTWKDLSPYWDYIIDTFTHTQVNASDPMISDFLKSAEELGYKYNPNPNNLNSIQGQGGVAPKIYTIRKISDNYARRVSSWNEYIEPILPRENLDILVFTHVHKILFDQDLKAIGVQTYNLGNKQYGYYYSTKEVVLSAGVFDTPKLLLLSGIGPCNELKDLNITCLSNVPGVGKNLEDHIRTPIFSAPLLNQSIPLSNYVLGGGGWGVTAFEENGENLQDLNIGEIDGIKAISIDVETFHYQSRGSVTLRDNNPLSRPVIDPNYLSNSYDEKKIVEAIKIGRSFFSTNILSSLTENRTNEIAPGYNITDDQALLNFAKEVSETDFHPASTCRMGNDFKNDDMIVVDKRLRVRNTKNLRIADGSIMPTLISGNPNQITMIIGFKAADMIIEDNSDSFHSFSHRLYPSYAFFLSLLWMFLH
jgi:choline dehydrogenase